MVKAQRGNHTAHTNFVTRYCSEAITREIAVPSSNQNGWQLELNEVAWTDGASKLELHRWAPNHEKCNKGVTLAALEAKAILAALQKEVTTLRKTISTPPTN